MDIELITLGLVAVNAAGLGYLLWSQTIGEHRRFKHEMVVDTSGLIDGRIIDIVRSGFVPQRLIVPQFVVAELQFLADQGDSFKRERARFGLDVIRRLQDMRQTEVVITPGRVRGEKAVDDKLVALAKKHNALLYTTDFNLNQVAQIEGVRVLNVNELAQGIRVTHLPGEKTEIKITNIGQDRTQGVGYLEDGTMVVVESAGKMVGQKVQVVFSRMLQTQAGKMMFATLPNGYKHHDEPHQRKHQPHHQQTHEQQQQHPSSPQPKAPQPARPEQKQTVKQPKPHSQSQTRRPRRRSNTQPEDQLIALANKPDNPRQ